MRAAVLAALLLSGCAYSPEVTVLVGPKRIAGDTETGVVISLIQRFGEHGACGYTHSSDPAHGKPFNDQNEFTLDSTGCGVRWGGKRSELGGR